MPCPYAQIARRIVVANAWIISEPPRSGNRGGAASTEVQDSRFGPPRSRNVPFCERRGIHPRATMQKVDREGVAGGATCKCLKTKVQICRRNDKAMRCERSGGSGGSGVGNSQRMIAWRLFLVKYYYDVVSRPLTGKDLRIVPAEAFRFRGETGA